PLHHEGPSRHGPPPFQGFPVDLERRSLPARPAGPPCPWRPRAPARPAPPRGPRVAGGAGAPGRALRPGRAVDAVAAGRPGRAAWALPACRVLVPVANPAAQGQLVRDRKSTRLNSSHTVIS